MTKIAPYALSNAVVTRPARLPPEAQKTLDLLNNIPQQIAKQDLEFSKLRLQALQAQYKALQAAGSRGALYGLVDLTNQAVQVAKLILKDLGGRSLSQGKGTDILS